MSAVVCAPLAATPAQIEAGATLLHALNPAEGRDYWRRLLSRGWDYDVATGCLPLSTVIAAATRLGMVGGV